MLFGAGQFRHSYNPNPAFVGRVSKGQALGVRHWNMSETGENVTEVNVISKYERFLFERKVA